MSKMMPILLFVLILVAASFIFESASPSSRLSAAAEFNGSSRTPDYIESYINSPFNNAFTVSFWMYPGRVGNGINGSVFSEDIVDILNGTSNLAAFPQMSTEWRGNGNFNENICTNGGQCSEVWVPVTALNKWVFVTEVYNNRNYSLYVNGTLQKTNFVYDFLQGAWTTKQSRLFISYVIPFSSNTMDDEFGGLISNVQIYNRSLNQSEVHLLFNRSISGSPIQSGLVAWYRLNGNANDNSGHGYGGVIYGDVNFVPLPKN